MKFTITKASIFLFVILWLSIGQYNPVHGQTISTVVGDSIRGYGISTGPVSNAKIDLDSNFINTPKNTTWTLWASYMTIDDSDNIYFSELSNHRIRKINPRTCTITTVAGNGYLEYSGDGGLATAAGIRYPYGLAVDHKGNLYFAESWSNVIRKVTASTGIITTIAGNGGYGNSLSGVLATTSSLQVPTGLTVDTAGNVYFTESGGFHVKKIDASTGFLYTIVNSSGAAGFSGDGGPAVNANVMSPSGIALDRAGNIYFSDQSTLRVRKITASTGIINTIAGNGTINGQFIGGYAGDGGPATSALLSGAAGLTVDDSGNVYIADRLNNVIRKVTASTGIITTIAGNGYKAGVGLDSGRFSGDGGIPTMAELNTPSDVALDSRGNLYIVDLDNNRIRKITVSGGGGLNVMPPSATICAGKSVTLTASGGSSYLWSPGTGLSITTGTSVIANPQSTITYTVTGGSGACTASQQVIITIGGKDTAGTITAVRDTLCQGTSGFLTLSGNSKDSIRWQSSINSGNFTNTGIIDTTKYQTNPLTQSTYYRVLVGNGTCVDTSQYLQLFVPPALTAYFNTTVSGSIVTFNSDSSLGNIISYSWNFGDGTTDKTKNPVHTFNKKDSTYNVCLTIYDGSNCSYTFCKDVSLATGIANVSAQTAWNIYPDPFSDYLFINGKELNSKIESVEIYDVVGRVVLNKNIADASTSPLTLNVSGLIKGMYFLKIKTVKADYVQKIIKQN